ncbi:hypothetical protein B6D60_09070 [candidate division KSB1 bacterium 4484_87]|nr:MAG: hypothetical protein B6D60_09070 [candidate division KSB1 bacterium 4484_87]
MRQVAMKLIALLFVISVLSCGLKKPTVYEGHGTLRVKVLDDAGDPVAGAVVYWTSHVGEVGPRQLSDSTGQTVFQGLSSSEYTIKAGKALDEKIGYLGSEKISLESGKEDSLTVQMRLNTAGLKINEIYYAGPVNNEFYFYDQFIELYNSGADTVYLDGTIFIRGGGYNLAGKDNDGDGAIDYFYFDTSDGTEHRCFVYAFKLPGIPGVSKNYPVAPGEFVVVASDAIDHREIISTSIDLSNADYEFYNPYFFRDPNNPDIPDYVNIIDGAHGRETTTDFMLNLSGDILLLASGVDSVYWDGIDIDTIIDGIEYSSNKDHIHSLELSIDKGFAGTAPDKVMTKYSGMSIQRIRPGFDTDNSTVDFTILDHPTPGYQ